MTLPVTPVCDNHRPCKGIILLPLLNTSIDSQQKQFHSNTIQGMRSCNIKGIVFASGPWPGIWLDPIPIESQE